MDPISSNTDKKDIWNYFNKFSILRPYVHHVKAFYNGTLYTLPVNLNTLSQFFGRHFLPGQAKSFLEQPGDKAITEPGNFEEQAIHSLGKDLYYAFFYDYTKKRWGCEPRELPASVLKRIPVRFDYNDNYHLHPYTGIPEKGYTDFINNLTDHPDITVSLNRRFEFDESILSTFDHIFYTGSVDAFFNYSEGRLSYRTLRFEKEIYDHNFQGCVQINYCD